METYNNAQQELIKLFRYELNEEELKELKQLISKYLAKKLVAEVDKIADEKGYTAEIVAGWKDEHFRTPYNNESSIRQ